MQQTFCCSIYFILLYMCRWLYVSLVYNCDVFFAVNYEMIEAYCRTIGSVVL